MMRFYFLALMMLPLAASAKESEPQTYGVGLLCPRPDTQITFYTESNQQDAAGTIAFATASGYAITSEHMKDLQSAGAHTIEGICENGASGIRIDSKRDTWFQAGQIWLPASQEWDYGDWQDYLRKLPIWKPLGPVALYQGNSEIAYRHRPYPETPVLKSGTEIYPLKFSEDGSLALVVVDENEAYNRTCSGSATPPKGRLGWMPLSDGAGNPTAVPVHGQMCELMQPPLTSFQQEPPPFDPNNQ